MLSALFAILMVANTPVPSCPIESGTYVSADGSQAHLMVFPATTIELRVTDKRGRESVFMPGNVEGVDRMFRESDGASFPWVRPPHKNNFEPNEKSGFDDLVTKEPITKEITIDGVTYHWTCDR